ncbi:hypothetical protein EMIT053CA3_250043 [Pseudomonas donghuensis]
MEALCTPITPPGLTLSSGTVRFVVRQSRNVLTPARLQGYTMRRVLTVTPMRTSHSC